MTLFKLLHTYYIFKDEPVESTRILGFFSDINSAEDAIAFYQTKPGYCDAQKAFIICACSVHGTPTDNVIYKAVIYAHTPEYGYDDYEYIVELGLFSDEESAQKAVDHFRANNPLFYSNTQFEIEEIIDKYKINQKCCAEGFDVVSRSECD